MGNHGWLAGSLNVSLFVARKIWRRHGVSLSVAWRIACKDTRLFQAFSCSWTPPSTFYTLL
jgi:hypothetical protein